MRPLHLAALSFGCFAVIVSGCAARTGPRPLAPTEESQQAGADENTRSQAHSGLVGAEEIFASLAGDELGGESRGLAPPRPLGIPIPIYFKHDSAELLPESLAQVGEVAKALANERLQQYRFIVKGFTDSTGSANYNLTLSQRRAEAVRRCLVEKFHVEPGRLVAKGYGESRQLPGGPDRNRRVELVRQDTNPQPTAQSSPPPPNVKVTVRYEKGGKLRVMGREPKVALTPQDNYRIDFTSNRNAYVYVYQIDSRKGIFTIFPNCDYSPATNPVQAKRAYHIPPGDQWLHLDETPGEEEIVVLASDKPLPDPSSVALGLPDPGLPQYASRGVMPDARAGTGDGPPVGAEQPGLFEFRLPFDHR